MIKKLGPNKQIIKPRKAKLSVTIKIFHGNKVYEKQQKVNEAFLKLQEYVKIHEPEIFEDIERKRRTQPARDLRESQSSNKNE